VALIDRLLATDATKIPVHAFMAALGEAERGKLTRQQAIDAFALGAEDLAELDALIAKVRTPLEAYPLSGRVVLTNVGANYDTNNDSLSLPFVYVQGAGVTRIDAEIRTRKVGTGTQDYQLWDETNAAAAIDTATATSGSLSDAGAAGDRTLSASRVFSAPLSPGVRKLRLRAKSSVATDDPVFLNAAILLFRVDTITADVLHHVLLLGEEGVAPLNTAAAVRARLGL
jgi:hypothetical protein